MPDRCITRVKQKDVCMYGWMDGWMDVRSRQIGYIGSAKSKDITELHDQVGQEGGGGDWMQEGISLLRLQRPVDGDRTVTSRTKRFSSILVGDRSSNIITPSGPMLDDGWGVCGEIGLEM